MQVGLGFWASKTLLSAVELGVFSTLANAPADLPTLQRKLALHQRSARDFLDALVALKLLERENGIYRKVDVIVMGHILHDWDLAQKKVLLGKVFDALLKGGAVIVYDAIIDDDRRENAFGLMMSLNMLIETPGGFDYTAEDCQAWMREVGFSKTRAEPLVGADSMVTGFK